MMQVSVFSAVITVYTIVFAATLRTNLLDSICTLVNGKASLHEVVSGALLG